MKKTLAFETKKTSSLNVHESENNNAAYAGDAGTLPYFKLIENLDVQWETPKPLVNNKKKDVMPLHPIMLPKIIRKYVLKSAESLNNTQPDFIAIAIIIALAALAGGNVEIKPKQNDKWTVALVIWGMMIGNASSMKTPSAQFGINFLQNIQDNIFEPNRKKLLNKYSIKKRIFDKKYKALEDKIEKKYANNDNDDNDEANKLFTELESLKAPEPPIARNIVINDATMEALCQRLENNPAGVLQFRDELSAWLNTLNQNGREHERAFFLEAFNGSKSKFTQDRISRENIELLRLIISIFGGIQPSLVTPLIKEKLSGTKDDGLLERLLQMSVYPDDSSLKITDIKVPQYLKEQTYKIFESIAQLNSYKNPQQFSFDKKAQSIWDKWSHDALEEQRTMPDELQSMWAKRPAHCAKLALVFHLIEQVELDKEIQKYEPNAHIGSKCLNRAIIWMRYLKSHTLRIIELGEKDESSASVESLQRNLPRLFPAFTKHTLSQKGWRGLKTPADRDKALRTLDLLGHIKEVQSPQKQYLVNPKYQPTHTA